MTTVIPPSSVREPATGHGGGGIPPRSLGGGGGGGRGDGYPDYGRRLRRARLGLALAIAPILMLFLAFTAVYIYRRATFVLDPHTEKYIREWIVVTLPVRLLLINTLVILASSFTLEMARRRLVGAVALAPVRSIPGISLGRDYSSAWLAATVVLGFAFLAGQWMAWQQLAEHSFHLDSNASSSFVYILTAAHAVHLSGGLLVLVYAGVITLLRRPVESRHLVVDVAAWYWHFMALLWMYIFGLLEFVK